MTPSLLWGGAAVTAPILIHLLMRQKPKPRPWAAMRWLLAAVAVAQRRYKLTNWLLLLLRCLILAFLALALSRPSLAGIGSGGHLVLIVDTTASMGPLADHHGALRQSLLEIEEHGLHHQRITVVGVGDGVQLREATSIDEAVGLLNRLDSSPLPGGVDLVTQDEQGNDLLAACTADSDVIVISDFRQDDGQALAGLLEEQVRSFTRWQTTGGETNALITGVDGISDLVPGMPGELLLSIQGSATGAEVSIDDGQALERPLALNADRARLVLPPLDAGQHRLRIQLIDQGLRYDNLLELPLKVRASVPAVVAERKPSTIGDAIRAAEHRFTTDLANPLALGGLPRRGLVVLRDDPQGQATRISEWVTRDGGVLWSPWPLLQANAGFKPLTTGIVVHDDPRPGGKLGSPTIIDKVLAANLGRVMVDTVPRTELPEGAVVLLSAGEDPFVIALPVGKGWVICDLIPIEEIEAIDVLVSWPSWVRKIARAVTSWVDQPSIREAGSLVDSELTLIRQGQSETIPAGQPLRLEPGLWSQRDEQDREEFTVVLPNKAEGRLNSTPLEGVARSAAEALPQQPGFNWGPSLLILVLLILLGEGALAAWAGKTYGR